MLRALLVVLMIPFTTVAQAGGLTGTFPSIDGGTLSIEDWRGQPVLVANTASRCGYTPQYNQLQALYDQYKGDGLIVLAVPSQDFRQELSSEKEVKRFCEVNFGLNIPMTGITSVRGADAHPFFAALKEQEDFEPDWNFNKVLIGPDGEFVQFWRSNVEPDSPAIVSKIEALLNGAD